ncbi:hypothetical protein AAGG74_15925 [Bacillus mexicanus]|uniref:hypothetical protein n=1 Tax=Bacillus mexicanus TaxID=2834415 RepID=UPI003D210FE4
MAMTLEEKVEKKAKGIEKLNYKKGVACLLLAINERSSEYDCETKYKVRLHFKSKAAIKRVGELLRLNRKNMLNRFEREIKSIELTLNSYEMFKLEAGRNINKEVTYKYRNDYTGVSYEVILNPTKDTNYDGYHTGSVADGEPLSAYFQLLKEAIVTGEETYIC